MKKYLPACLVAMAVLLLLAGCSPGPNTSISQSFDSTTVWPISATLIVPATATTVSLSGTATIQQGSGSLGIYVLDPSNQVEISKAVSGTAATGQQEVTGSATAVAGTWTLRVSGQGATGNFSLTLSY